MLKRRSTVSTRFVITTAVVYSVIIILILLSFLYILNISSGTLKEILLKNNETYILKKTGLIVERLNEKNIRNLKTLSKELKNYCSKDNDFLHVLIFSDTSDENYFKLQKEIQLNKSFKIKVARNKLIQETKDTNFMKTGLTQSVADPVIYSLNDQYYKNVYYPFTVKSNYIIEFYISSSELITTLDDYSDKINTIKKYSVIVTACAIIVIIITTILFNYSFLVMIKNLSGHLKKVAEGSSNEDIPGIQDDDLNELAESLNGIFSELKSKKDLTGELFKSGVELLKQEQFADSIAVFKTILIYKPDTFGACFNLGVAYAKIRQYKLSAAMFEKALEANPGHKVTTDYISRVNRILEAQNKNAKSFAEIKR